MKHDEIDIDEILARDAGIAPSSGFVSGVMEAVRLEAAAPPPIPFPWMRALPGLVGAVAALVAMIVAIARSVGPDGKTFSTQSLLIDAVRRGFDVAKVYGAQWIVLAIFLSAICMAVAMRFVAGPGRTL